MPEASVAILYPTDPAASVPSGIDSLVKGIIKGSPPDLEHTLFGASSDLAQRPLGKEALVQLGDRTIRYIPIVSVDPSGRRSKVPLTLRYLWSLRNCLRAGALSRFDVLDFHRIEPVTLFRRDPRPKNLVVHQDMSILRDKNSDIMWRHAPWLYEALERRLMESVDTVFTVRRSAVERYTQIYPRIGHKFRFIPTWVDTSVFKPNESDAVRTRLREDLIRSTGAHPDASLLVFVGRLDRQKDPLLLLRAFAEARRIRPHLQLLVVGDGAMKSEMQTAIRSGGLQAQVMLLGVLPAAEICEVLRASDLFVLSSAYEGMPIAVLEALATGLPVVSTRVGEVPAVVNDGKNGFIAADRSPPALARAICAAADQVALLRGAPCTQSVIPYHPSSVLNQLYELHRSQASRGGREPSPSNRHH